MEGRASLLFLPSASACGWCSRVLLTSGPLLCGAQVVSPWLDERTRSKIEVVRGDAAERLRELVAAETLPAYYGGRCAHCLHEAAGADVRAGRVEPAPPPAWPLPSRQPVTGGSAGAVEPAVARADGEGEPDGADALDTSARGVDSERCRFSAHDLHYVRFARVGLRGGGALSDEV